VRAAEDGRHDLLKEPIDGQQPPRRRPDFSAFTSRELRNLKTGEAAALVRADLVRVTPERVEEVVRICNEPRVYDVLFRRTLRGAPYPPEKAIAFLDGAARGWRERTHFVFLIVAAGGRLVGNVDIEADDLAAAEIGYWATASRAGFISPAVAAVCDLARAAGYRSLYAHTRPDNERSVAVLRRSGFRDADLIGAGADRARRFVRVLAAEQAIGPE
jgi:RimJ/RimL family protein N-acetyltransferase